MRACACVYLAIEISLRISFKDEQHHNKQPAKQSRSVEWHHQIMNMFDQNRTKRNHKDYRKRNSSNISSNWLGFLFYSFDFVIIFFHSRTFHLNDDINKATSVLYFERFNIQPELDVSDAYFYSLCIDIIRLCSVYNSY